MEDFALQLEGCSKADRKKVIKAAKSSSIHWYDGYRFKDGSFDYIQFDIKDIGSMWYVLAKSLESRDPIYQMPQDWSLIQEALGVSVEPKYMECTITIHETSFKGGVVYMVVDNKITREDGEESFSDADMLLRRSSFKPSTKEAYEAQEAKKSTKIGELHYEVIIDVKPSSIDLFGIDRIKELEEENEKLSEEVDKLNSLLRGLFKPKPIKIDLDNMSITILSE